MLAKLEPLACNLLLAYGRLHPMSTLPPASQAEQYNVGLVIESQSTPAMTKGFVTVVRNPAVCTDNGV